jgi:hypothetical protein
MMNVRDHLSSRAFRGTALLLLALLAALAYSYPIFRDFGNWGIQDWDQHLFYHAVPRHTILHYHEFPLWNPWYCGGAPLLANPQSRFLSPTYLCVLLLGAVRGIKVEILLHLVVGLVGAYRLARSFRMSRPASALTASLFVLNSSFALNLTVGMTWFLSAAYIPWAFHFYLKAMRDLRWSAASGACLAMVFLGGGIYPVVIAVLFLFVYALFAVLLEKRRFSRAAAAIFLSIAFALSISAIKAIPAWMYLKGHPRLIDDYSGYSLSSLVFSLFSRDQQLGAIESALSTSRTGFFGGVSWFMDENGMYVGIVAALLCLLGMISRFRRRPALALCLVLSLWLAFGSRAPLSLWNLIHELPVFASMRVAQRYRIVFLLAFSLFAGFGLDSLLDRLRRLRPRFPSDPLAAAAVLVISADLILVSSRVFREAFPIPPLPVGPPGAFRQVESFSSYGRIGWVAYASNPRHISWGGLYPAFLSNLGVIKAYESAEVPRMAIPSEWPSYRGEIFLEGTEGSATLQRWTPNALTIETEADRPGYLIVNQNYDPGWKIAGGGTVEKRRGLIAVKIPFRRASVALYYQPPGFRLGLAVSAAGCLLAAAVLRRTMRLRGRQEEK